MKFREMRYPCECPAELLRAGGEQAVVIVNISAKGARVARAEGLEPGDPVTLRMAGGRHGAQVRWQRKGLTGLRFERIIGQATLAAVRKATGHRSGRSSGWNLHLREMGAPATRAG